MLITRSPLKNCMSCASYLKCNDPHKSVMYSCPSFSRGKNDDGMKRLFAELDMEAPTKNGKILMPRNADSDNMMTTTGVGPPTSNSDNFDIYSLIDDAISSKSIVSPDIKLKDGDFKTAPNFLEFCTSDQYLNQKPYTSQALIGIRLFGEWCPRCSDADYFDTYNVRDSLDKLRSKISIYEHGVCPGCKGKQSKAFGRGRLNMYYELAISAGQRSGKSAVTAMLTAYITHRMLKLPKPNEVYGLARSNVFHGTFVALTYAQAKDTLWDPFYGNVLESPWFRGYHELLSDYGARTGEELFKINDTFITYKHRRMVIYPAGPDKRTLRGRTRFFASIDELGWFDNSSDSGKVKMDATQVYIALERSLLTVRAAATNLWERGFTELPTGYFINVSSPSSVRDKIMELVRKSQGSTVLLGLVRPTWEMNPNVTRKHLAEEFKADPVAAMRDYGAQPPLTANAFLSRPLIEGAVGEKRNVIELSHVTKTGKNGNEPMRYATITKIGRGNKPSCLALDAGYVNNSFAFAVGHLEDRKNPRLTIVGEIQPLPGIKLNFTRIYKKIILPIIEARNIQLVAADRWNSIKILSDVEEDTDSETRQYSLKYADMRMFKDYVESKQLILPNPKCALEDIEKYDQSNYPNCFRDDPIGHFYLQLMTVQDTGASVIKGDQLTDDMVRAAMLCVRMLLDETYEDKWLSGDRAETPIITDPAQMGVSKGYSGGGGSGGAMAHAGASLGVRKSRAG